MDVLRSSELSGETAVELGALGVGIGAVVALVVTTFALRWAPARLLRDNYRGVQVPAVLGYAFAVAAASGLLLLGSVAGSRWNQVRAAGVPGAALLILVAFTVAGTWDDLRGQERARGFAGHWVALRGGALTGGVVKVVVGGAAGLIAGRMLAPGWAEVLATGLLVALTANTANLLDRAPGRVSKFALAVVVPLGLWGARAWTVSVSAALGALVAVLPFDLRERGMLGDAGANPLGGLLGLGLAVGLPAWGRWTAIVVLVALNVASERWSFSAAIDRSSWLRRIDRAGRVDPDQQGS